MRRIDLQFWLMMKFFIFRLYSVIAHCLWINMQPLVIIHHSLLYNSIVVVNRFNSITNCPKQFQFIKHNRIYIHRCTLVIGICFFFASINKSMIHRLQLGTIAFRITAHFHSPFHQRTGYQLILLLCDLHDQAPVQHLLSHEFISIEWIHIKPLHWTYNFPHLLSEHFQGSTANTQFPLYARSSQSIWLVNTIHSFEWGRTDLQLMLLLLLLQINFSNYDGLFAVAIFLPNCRFRYAIAFRLSTRKCTDGNCTDYCWQFHPGAALLYTFHQTLDGPTFGPPFTTYTQ